MKTGKMWSFWRRRRRAAKRRRRMGMARQKRSQRRNKKKSSQLFLFYKTNEIKIKRAMYKHFNMLHRKIGIPFMPLYLLN